MNPRQAAAFALGSAASRALRLLGRGGGALPGLIAERIDPSLLSWFASRCPEGVIVVCGTNGKTTTSRLLSDILTPALGRPIQNRSGSNMLRGHLSAFLSSPRARIAILEVDEAVLPIVLKYVDPRCIILHNLFRDQLDRYGEVDSTARKWASALAGLPATTALLINADDPNLAYLGASLSRANTRYYGIEDASAAEDKPLSAVDAYLSPASGEPLHYSRYYLSHLGVYDDPQGGFTRPRPDLAATHIRGTSFRLSPAQGDPVDVTLPLPGLYNTYNALAAAHAATTVDISPAECAVALAKAQGAFGRFERIAIGKSELVFCLIKNPVGATEVMRTISSAKEDYGLAFIANDKFADGQDVSWYWDSAFEQLARPDRTAYCGGTRALDLAVRLKYAGFATPSTVEQDIPSLLATIVSGPARTTYVLCTYTATLEAQAWLARQGYKQAYWEE